MFLRLMLCFTLALATVGSFFIVQRTLNAGREAAETNGGGEAGSKSVVANDLGLLSIKPDWGTPPSEDWPEEMPDLPRYEGWYRFLGNNPSMVASKLAATPLYLLFCHNSIETRQNAVTAYDIGTGSEIWQREFAINLGSFSIAADEINAYYCETGNTTALRINTGEVGWTSEKYMPIAAVSGKVWALKSDLESKEGTYNGVALLSSADGSIIFEHKYDVLNGAGAKYYPRTTIGAQYFPFINDASRLAAKIGKEIVVFNTDGSLLSFPARLADGNAGFLFEEDTLYVVEYLNSSENSIDNEDDFSVLTHLRRHDIKSGKNVWQVEFDGGGFATDYDEIYRFGNMVSVCKYAGLLSFDIESGRQVFEIAPEYIGPTLSDDAYNAWGFYTDEPIIDFVSPPSFGLLAPHRNGEFAAMALKFNVITSAATSGKLILAAETATTGHSFWGANAHLIALDIGTDGMPLPGTLKVVSAPASNAALIERFYSEKDPSSDNALMREIVALGAKVYRPLVKAANRASESQLDDLIALAVYMDEVANRQVANIYSASKELFNQLAVNASPEMSDHIIRWLNDDSIKSIHTNLLGLLALCGDSKAGRYLEAHYREYRQERREAKKAPYAILKPGRVNARMERKIEEIDEVWHEFTSENGRNYLVYISPGLISARDIYLAIDADCDGLYEEVLPTGLSDVYYFNVHPGGLTGVTKRIGPLRGRLDGDDIYISYHQPTLVEEIYQMEDGSEYRYWAIDDAKYVTSKLSMVDLRRDSDSDGLTDILESMLFTDPSKADSDGDGINDYSDAFPGIVESDIGVQGRALTRAFAYFCREFNYGWQSAIEGHPWVADYINVEGDVGVRYSTAPDTFAISLSDEEHLALYFKMLNGFNSDSIVHLSFQENVAFMGIPLSSHAIELAEINGEWYPVQSSVCSMS